MLRQTTAELEHQSSDHGLARGTRAFQNWVDAHTDSRVNADGRVTVPPRSDCGRGRGTRFQSKPWTFEALVWRWHAACLGRCQRPALSAHRDCTPVLRQWLRTLGL